MLLNLGPRKKKGVKGKVIEKKKDEMKDYMERVGPW